MTTRRSFRWFWLTLSTTCLALCFVTDSAIMQSQPDANLNAITTTANGLTVVTFTTNPGKIILNLPSDMAAGDTISGTVVTEPKGNSAEEKAKDQSVLNGYVIDLGEGTKVPANQPRFTWTPQMPQSATKPRYQIKLVEVLPQPRTESGAVITPEPKVIARAVITPNPKMTYPATSSGAIVTPDPKVRQDFNIPSLGQTGRPVVITGPFDGDSSNTKVDLQAVGLSGVVPVTGDWDGFFILAESPREIVATTPASAPGPAQIRVMEGSRETMAPFRTVAVKLSAPKTSLLKGESTQVHVEVSGLEGVKEPIPLQIEATGTVTMSGGNSQTLTIQPSQVGPGGSYSTTRGVNGTQAGAWGATATVVVNVKSKDELLEELETLRRNKKYDCDHSKSYQKAMADRIAAIKRALRGFHNQTVLNDPIDENCP